MIWDQGIMEMTQGLPKYNENYVVFDAVWKVYNLTWFPLEAYGNFLQAME